MTATEPITSGTVTFVFTDIEGSTRLEQRVGTTRYGELRERHREILRVAFDAQGGEEQGTEGDSFFVVFKSAAAALKAAVAAQRRLAVEPWPEGASIRVRIGIHTGEAERAGDGLVGLDINRAARIAAVGHGGQILASDRPAPWRRRTCRPTSGCATSGRTGSRTCSGRSTSSRSTPTACATDFPPLRTPDARPNNLPTQLTTLHRAHDGARRGDRTPGLDSAADPDRTRRHGQDPPLAPARVDGGRRVPGRRVLRAARADP